MCICLQMFTQHDVEKRIAGIDALLSNKDAPWEKRVAAVSISTISLQYSYYLFHPATVKGAEVRWKE